MYHAENCPIRKCQKSNFKWSKWKTNSILTLNTYILSRFFLLCCPKLFFIVGFNSIGEGFVLNKSHIDTCARLLLLPQTKFSHSNLCHVPRLGFLFSLLHIYVVKSCQIMQILSYLSFQILLTYYRSLQKIPFNIPFKIWLVLLT